MLNDWWLDNRFRPVSSENCSNLNESSRPIAQPASLDAPKRSVVTESFVPKADRGEKWKRPLVPSIENSEAVICDAIPLIRTELRQCSADGG